MERNERLYPVSEEIFKETVMPVIEGNRMGKGRPPKAPHYKAFCGVMYALRTGCPWRDLPEEYGFWHVIYDRFSRGNERGLWVKVLAALQNQVGTEFREVIIDSTTMKIHRHGGGQKGAADQRSVKGGDKHEVSFGRERKRFMFAHVFSIGL